MTVQSLTTAYTFGSMRYDLPSRTHIMGILNVTPDSFSDGGNYADPEKAFRHALEMIEQGADFIDVGGESSRPGSEPVSAEEELKRVLPVIQRLSKATNIPISIDTYKREVAERALESGAVIINDISGLHFDPRLADVAAKANATMILMHMKGTPKSMQANPEYENVVEEICNYFEESIRIAESKGVHQIILDPGIGFGKKLSHNLEIFKKLSEFQKLSYPILIGPSRKSFINNLLHVDISQRLEGTAAAVAVSIMNGAQIVRVHDVKEMKRIAVVVDAIQKVN